VRAPNPPSAFMRLVDLHIDEATPEGVRGWVEVGSQHHQPYGIVHGGVYMSIVEEAASIGASAAVMDQGLIAVGVNNNTHFLRSMVEGRLDVRAGPVHRGRTQQLWQVDIARADGALVATGQLRVQHVEPRPEATATT
jgi:1,4-dihydroxy-2-naphthoyl-CoA hydrolase